VLTGLGQRSNWVHQGVIIVVLRDGHIFLVGLLVLEIPSDPFRIDEVWIVVGQFSGAGEETNIFNATKFGFTFGWITRICIGSASPEEG